MNISIDARGANLYKGSGIGTYIENLLREIINLDSINKYTIFWSGSNYSDFKRENTSINLTSKKHGSFYENYYYSSYTSNNNIDLHHIPQNGIGLNYHYTCPCVVTIHDLIPYLMPETVGSGYLQKFLKDIPFIIEECKGILTVSEYSKKDILRFFPNYPSEKIFVTPLAANSTFKKLNKSECKMNLKHKYNIDNPFVLYIGGFSSRKNVKNLITSFKNIYSSLNSSNYKLVLCGSVKDEGNKLVDYCSEIGISEHVIFTGFVPDEDLPLFYNSSDVFVYPSLYEGFGLPPLEAMNCGTPVITSNLTSIPEVCNDSAILIDPFNKDELSTSLLNILNSPSLRDEYSIKGFNNSKNFNWKSTAKLTLDAYNKIYSSLD